MRLSYFAAFWTGLVLITLFSEPAESWWYYKSTDTSTDTSSTDTSSTDDTSNTFQWSLGGLWNLGADSIEQSDSEQTAEESTTDQTSLLGLVEGTISSASELLNRLFTGTGTKTTVMEGCVQLESFLKMEAGATSTKDDQLKVSRQKLVQLNVGEFPIYRFQRGLGNVLDVLKRHRSGDLQTKSLADLYDILKANVDFDSFIKLQVQLMNLFIKLHQTGK